MAVTPSENLETVDITLSKLAASKGVLFCQNFVSISMSDHFFPGTTRCSVRRRH